MTKRFVILWLLFTYKHCRIWKTGSLLDWHARNNEVCTHTSSMFGWLSVYVRWSMFIC